MSKLKNFWKRNKWDILFLSFIIFLLFSIITGIVFLIKHTENRIKHTENRIKNIPKKEHENNKPYYYKENCENNSSSIWFDNVLRCEQYKTRIATEKQNELLKKRNGLLEKINSKIDWYENEIKNYKIQLSLIKKSQQPESELH